MRIHVGTSGFGLPPAEHYRRFDVVEVPRVLERPPSLAEARQWRAEAPDDFAFTLRADCRDLRETPALHRAWRSALELSRTLAAPLVVVRTPRTFGPAADNVRDLVRFAQWAHRDRLRLGWEPRGDAWEDERVRDLCRELSLTHVTDPFHRACLRPRPPYFRLGGITGHAHRFTETQLHELHELCAAAAAAPRPPESQAWCIFGNRTMVPDATRFRRATADGPAGR